MLELALYHPDHGFYGSGRGAGRGRDFLTSPEVGPLFGAVLARAIDGWWDELGQPDPFVVAEAGAGAGTLAKAVLDAAPRCAPALRYLLVERSEALRERQRDAVRLEPARFVLGPVVTTDPDEGPHPLAGSGPLAASLAELPAVRFNGVVVANELLDNLPFLLLERDRNGWLEVRVDEHLDEVLVAAEPDLAAAARRFAPDARTGARVPLQLAAAGWLRAAVGSLERGRAVVVDYADSTASLATRPWTEWVRTYRAHGRGSSALDALGEQDVTCEVAVDQLAHVRAIGRDRSQADFLRDHGIDDLAAAARAEWQERAHVADLAALAARSRASEAAALTDPAGLGAFRVLEWVVP